MSMQTRLIGTDRFASVTVGALFVGILMAGCHDEAPPATPPVVTTIPTTTVAPPAGTVGTTSVATMPDTKINTNAGPGASTGTDTALADAVNTAIVHNKQMTGSRVEPVATAGVVTLTGQVQNQQQKALAEKTASQVPGVGSVKNKLIIVSTGGAKPKPEVITKIKIVTVHDKAAPAPSDIGTTNTTQPPAPPAAPAPTDAGSNP